MTQVILSPINIDQIGEIVEISLRKVIDENQSKKPPQDERLTRHEVCALYKISLPTLHKAMREGLPFEKIYRKTIFRRQEIDQYFRNKKG